MRVECKISADYEEPYAVLHISKMTERIAEIISILEKENAASPTLISGGKELNACARASGDKEPGDCGHASESNEPGTWNRAYDGTQRPPAGAADGSKRQENFFPKARGRSVNPYRRQGNCLLR